MSAIAAVSFLRLPIIIRTSFRSCVSRPHYDDDLVSSLLKFFLSAMLPGASHTSILPSLSVPVPSGQGLHHWLAHRAEAKPTVGKALTSILVERLGTLLAFGHVKLRNTRVHL